MTRDQLFTAFFFAVFFFLIYQCYLVLSPFLAPLFLALVLVITFSSLSERVVKLLGGSRSLSAGAMTVGIVLLVLVPLLFLGAMLVSEASDFHDQVDALRNRPEEERRAIITSLQKSWQQLQERFPILASMDFSTVSIDASKRVAAWVASEGQVLVGGVASSLLNLSMMLVAVFFFFRDGDRMAALVREFIPMETADRDRILQRLYDTVQVVVQSTFAVAILQGIAAGIGYAFIGGLSVSVFLGFLTAIAALIPMVGSALIWFPTAIYLLATSEIGRGIALMLWGALVVGSIDNFVRPLMIGGRVEIPTFLLLFALLGGVQVYGMLGILVAPVVVAMLIGFAQIYRERLGEASQLD